MPEKSKVFYRRNLPHLQPLGGVFFVTCMLQGAIPKQVNEQWIKEHEEELIKLKCQPSDPSYLQLEKEIDRKLWLKREKFLDSRKNGPFYFDDDRLARVAAESLYYWDGKKIELICFCIMPNHVHAVFRTLQPDEVKDSEKVILMNIMHSIKRYSANRCNRLLQRSGRFWQEESFDRLVRDRKELARIISYVINNPAKAGFCTSPKEWKWTYLKPEYNEFI